MAATVHNDLPDNYGELEMARRVRDIAPPSTHLWFGLGSLPNVKEIDMMLWDEKVGVFVVEIKAISLDMILEINADRCTISGRGPGPAPHKQAHNALMDLRSYLKITRRSWTAPFMVSTAAFPKITRREWQERMRSPWCRVIEGSLLFEEDLSAGYPTLRQRLEHIWYNPPARSGSDRAFLHQDRKLREFNELVCPPAVSPSPPAPSDLAKLRVIEKGVAREARDQVPAFSGERVFYNGYPGTGKTFRLLQIGAEHASDGATVLYLCYNKVLAADIRRVLEAGSQTGLHEKVRVLDTWALLVEREGDIGHQPNRNEELDERAVRSVEEIAILSEELPKYDTVLIDEAQDMSDWQLELAQLQLADGGTLVVAAGSGQELYGDRSDMLEALQQTSQPIQLRRNFRNTAETFQLAYVAFESRLQPNRISSAAQRFKKRAKGKGDQGVLFDRERGRFPIFEQIDTSAVEDIEDRSTSFYAEEEIELLTNAYVDLIEKQLRELQEDDQPIDFLVLVPDTKCRETEAARKALTKIEQPFADLTVKELRRSAVPATHVRLCTFHSARGTEGHRVLILGFDRLELACKESSSPPHHLAYIALSRAVFETVIAVRSDRSGVAAVTFTQEAIAQLTEPF